MKHEPMLRDSMTGAYLRSYFQERLDEEIERHSRLNSSLALVVIDLDHFKSINDAFGHARGDQVLVEFADRVHGAIRAYDLLFRYGGDEFVLLMPGVDKPSALILAQRLLDSIQMKPITGEPPIHLTLSVGVAVFPEEAGTAAGLFERADARAYLSKRHGRGQVVGDELELESEAQSSFEYSSRLLERESALETLNGFFDALPESKRGLLLVSAPRGAGRSRFLLEVGQVARLRGYAVLSLSGNSGRRARIYGVFSELAPEWEQLPSPSMGQAAFTSAIDEYLVNKRRAGLLILVDNAAELDPASLDFLEGLISSPAVPSNAFVCSGDAKELDHWRQIETPLREEVTLRQLSAEGTRLWLRGVLRWEAPEAFRAWLHAATGGLPGNLQRALRQLVEDGVLTSTAQGWKVDDSFITQAPGNFLDESAESPLYNLPVSLSMFVGREAELHQIKRHLARQRLVTLVGQGGMGKTRLAIQTAVEMRNDFQHGVGFVPLADISVPGLMVSVIAQALRFEFHGQRDPRRQLLDYLRGKKMLLVFDNFEHLLDDGTILITEILQEAPQVKILVTCREQLGLPDESIIELRGLTYPSAPAYYSEHYPAIQLFHVRAQKKANALIVTEADRPHVTRICQLVDGLPLGIELAAAWASTFTYQEIAAEIERNVDFLESAGGQHNSLRAVFEYLWNALLIEEQNVLCKLSMFHGGFRLEAARYIAGAAPFFISALFDKACLVKTSGNRYAMPEVFRQYAEEKFSAQPEEQAETVKVYGNFYMSLLEKLSSELEGTQQSHSLTVLSEEIANVRVAWLWAMYGRHLPELQQGLFSLYQYYDIKSLYRDGYVIFGQAIEILGNIESETSEEARLLLGHFLVYRGALAVRLRLQTPAREALEHARTIFTELGTITDRAFVALQLGLLANTFSELEQADIELNTALQLYREANMQMGTAHALAALGRNAWSQVHLVEARTHAQTALEIYELLDNQREQASVLNLLGNIAWDIGEYENGYQYYERSLALSRKLGDNNRIALSLNNLGYTQYLLGQYKISGQFLQESLRTWIAMGDRAGEALSLNNLGFLAYLQGNYSQAEELNRRSLELRLELGNIQEVAFSKHIMSLLLTMRGEYMQARLLSEENLETFRSQNNPILSANVIAQLAHLAALEKNWEQAEQLGQEALKLSRSAGEPHSQILALNVISKTRIAQQQSQTVRVLLNEALSIAIPINWPPEILEIIEIFGEVLHLNGEYEQASLILVLVAEHPASSARTRVQAKAQVERLQSQFVPEIWEAICASARNEKLEDLALRLLTIQANP